LAGRLFASGIRWLWPSILRFEIKGRPAGKPGVVVSELDLPMELKLYDTLTRKKRVFRPLNSQNVRMYVCGPTVYDFAHIGNARPVIVFDVLFRLLQYLAKEGIWDGGKGETKVTYVRNITDVDDKINERAANDFPLISLNEAIRLLTKVTEDQFHEDVDALGCQRPTVEPRATDHIGKMIEFIVELIESKHAYPSQGHVFYNVSSKRDYGKLSRRTLKDMIAGSRIEPSQYKLHPLDFVLWKPSPPELPGWDSPWGRGRPGWHIECSAMSDEYLGETFDIHGGGIDLIFPHHENEIAQSEAAHHGRALANFWVHNNFLELERKKMSKSEGNVIKIRDLLQTYPGDVVRLLMFSGQYRQPIDWTQGGLESAREELLKWSELIVEYFQPSEDLRSLPNPDPELIEALCDDLNTSVGLAYLRETFRLAQQGRAPIEKFVGNLVWLGFRHLNHPGYFHQGFDAHLYRSGPEIGPSEIQAIVKVRASAANGLFQTTQTEVQRLDDAGFKVTLNEAGVLFVGNKTSAEMAATNEPVGRARYSSRQSDTRTIDHAEVEALINTRNEARRNGDYETSDRIRDYLVEKGVILKDSKEGTTWEIAR
jgi:cysteinyl-tRNA synthetase